jgi:hypothetical protein
MEKAMAEDAGRIQRLLDYWIEGKGFTAKEEAHIRSCAACRKGLRDFLALEEAMHREAQAARESCPPEEVMAALFEGEAPPPVWKKHVEECPYCQLDLADLRRAGLLEPAEGTGAPEWLRSFEEYLGAARRFVEDLAPAPAPVPAYRAAASASVPVRWRSEEAQEVQAGPCTVRFTRKEKLWVVEVSPWPVPGRVLVRLSKGTLRMAVAIESPRQEMALSLWTDAMVEFEPGPPAPARGGDSTAG